ncbi:hypothetical protein [Paracidovorax wautersii]|uniref:Uncharacterized protein n=1 Tax=Paracidovorax wautersii TaxID=1177982 RepID=A0ABU1IGF7_9BURK|nr:hypothetical protein [Paracidovorax wautersii]MDR6216215.1 hypothetical protein [Paracidovorax wautersii]
MNTETHPGESAVTCFGCHVRQKNLSREKRHAAAQHRKQAKLEKLQVDAYALRQKAKTLTTESRICAASAKAARDEMLEHAEAALKQLTARMPPEYQGWGATKTHIFAQLLQVLAAQVNRVSPSLPVIAEALQLLLTHHTWDDRTLMRLGGARTAAWPAETSC